MRWIAAASSLFLLVPPAALRAADKPAASPAATPAASPAKAAPASVARGSYECWAFNSARAGLNFEVTGDASYVDSEGKKGSYSYDPATGRIVFKSGLLSDAMPDGFSSVYHEKGGKPTVSFRGKSGSEASFCERVGK